MISTNRRNNGVWSFFYPITNIVGGQNSWFNRSSGRLTWSLSHFAADLLVAFRQGFHLAKQSGLFWLEPHSYLR